MPPNDLVSYFEIHYTSEEKEAEGLKGAELIPHFPQNFGMSTNRHVTEITLQKKAFTTHKACYKHASQYLENDTSLNEGRNFSEKNKCNAEREEN